MRPTPVDSSNWQALWIFLMVPCVHSTWSLNERTKARLPCVGPTGSFAEFIEWVLVCKESLFTIGLLRYMSLHPRKGWRELLPRRPGSKQVCEPATPFIAEGVLLELKGWEESPTNNPTAVNEIMMDSGKYYDELKEIFEEDLIYFFGEFITSSPVSPEFLVYPAPPVSPEFPSSLLLPPPQSASSSALPLHLPYASLWQ